MERKPTDNLINCLEKIASRLESVRSEAETAEILRESAAEMREFVNSERLEAAGRLAAWLSHQINNPLGIISGSAQLLARRLERDISDADQVRVYAQYIEAIRSQTERCAGITGELLSFTRLRDLDLESVDVMEAVAEAVDMARYRRGQCRVLVVPDRNANLPSLWTDKELLTTVLYEVIVNAIRAASEDGTVTVEVAAVCAGGNGAEWVQIRVTDSGPGIPEDALPRIFDPFFSTEEKARGLGLTTSLAIMQQLGGTIEVSETGPSGTVISIRLPVGGRSDERAARTGCR